MEEFSQRLLVHEYGHTKSYFRAALSDCHGIPSILWGFLTSLQRKRKNEPISYLSFYTERWANYLGEKVTDQKSMGNRDRLMNSPCFCSDLFTVDSVHIKLVYNKTDTA